MAKLSRMSRVMLVLLAAGTLATAPAGLPAQTPAPAGPQEVRVVGVFLDSSGTQPALVLQGKRDKRSFAMGIGAAEATGIVFPLENRVPPRPLTHDLFLTLFGRLKVTVTRVVVTDLKDGIYYATVVLDASGREIQLDSRPSDAIALAIRAKAPVLVEDRVFDKSDLLPGAPSAPRI
ncbi:MAG TPA: bifunctional nuclease domain-containing protein [Candidatus Eisenbacteria bacterium]|nr:bifunctional nuclease domain-containing protein [Candidatus Eisenbacteria bacterium]